MLLRLCFSVSWECHIEPWVLDLVVEVLIDCFWGNANEVLSLKQNGRLQLPPWSSPRGESHCEGSVDFPTSPSLPRGRGESSPALWALRTLSSERWVSLSCKWRARQLHWVSVSVHWIRCSVLWGGKEEKTVEESFQQICKSQHFLPLELRAFNCYSSPWGPFSGSGFFRRSKRPWLFHFQSILKPQRPKLSLQIHSDAKERCGKEIAAHLPAAVDL